MSEKTILASRSNGALSKGPITEQGKRNSSRNSLRHGLLAKTVVLAEESVDRFKDLLASYMDEYHPTTASQVSLVETMAVARWRQLRVWAVQKTALDRDMAHQDPNLGPPAVRALNAMSNPSDHLIRYEIAFDRQFSRALARLLELQSLSRNKGLEPYNPDTQPGETWFGPEEIFSHQTTPVSD